MLYHRTLPDFMVYGQINLLCLAVYKVQKWLTFAWHLMIQMPVLKSIYY